MARFYSQLKALELTCESQPVEVLSKANWSDSLFLIRGKDEGIPAWHYILVPHNKINDLKNHKSGETIDCKKVGRVIQYRDNHGQIYPSSGWGLDPTHSFRTWIEKQYGDRSFDENTKFEYEKDDIRLCTMQRLTSDELIGIYRYYNQQGRFHYLKLFDDYEKTLAYRGGVRNFDRLISLNGFNIEEETLEETTKRFHNQLHLPVQILVCSPATYEFYKSRKISIHPDLPTVQHLKPVFQRSPFDEDQSRLKNSLSNETFYVVQWENSEVLSVVSQSSIFKSADFIRINDISFVEIQGKYRRAMIRFQGSKDQCKTIEKSFIKQGKNVPLLQYSPADRSIYGINGNNKRSSEKTLSSLKSMLEDLPNELFLDLFDYLKVGELHDCFLNLNSRLNTLLFNRLNVSFVADENVDMSMLNLYRSQIKHLKMLNSNQYDLRLFPNLSSLRICQRDLNQSKQIRGEILPNLVCLSFQLKFDYEVSDEVVDQIFSNQFQHLRCVHLRLIRRSLGKTWSIVHSLRKISLHSNQLMIIEDILQSCPNLLHLHVHFLYKCDLSMKSLSLKYSSVETFVLTSQGFELTFDLLEMFFTLMPNLQRLYLQAKCRILFIDLIGNLRKRLENLKRFDCFIKEVLMKHERIGDLKEIRQISSCFQAIQCVKENDQYRIFATD